MSNHSEMTDLTGNSTMAGTEVYEETGAAVAQDLVHQLGQFSLDSSPVLATKTPRKYALRELEIQQTIGWCRLFVEYCL